MFKAVLISILVFGLDSTDKAQKSRSVSLLNPHANHINYKSNAFKTKSLSISKSVTSKSVKMKSNRNYKMANDNKTESVIQLNNVNTEKDNMLNRNYKAN